MSSESTSSTVIEPQSRLGLENMQAVARWLEIELARIRAQISEAETMLEAPAGSHQSSRTLSLSFGMDRSAPHAENRSDIARSQWLRFVITNLRSGELNDKQRMKIIEGATSCPAWMSLPEVTDEDRVRIRALMTEASEGHEQGGEAQRV